MSFLCNSQISLTKDLIYLNIISNNMIIRLYQHPPTGTGAVSYTLVRRIDQGCTSVGAHFMYLSNHISFHSSAWIAARWNTDDYNRMLQVLSSMSHNICFYSSNLSFEISHGDHGRVDSMVRRASRANVRKDLSARPRGPWFMLGPV
jgi:hypothetical protein